MKSKKNLSKLLTLFLILTILFTFTACQSKVDDGIVEDVVITVSAEEYSVQGKTLKDYMDYLVGEGKLTYLMDGSLLSTVNGTSNTANSYWMIYTDDEENSDTTWGTIEKNGKVYASATSGITSLPIKDGCTYILTYQTF